MIVHKTSSRIELPTIMVEMNFNEIAEPILKGSPLYNKRIKPRTPIVFVRTPAMVPTEYEKIAGNFGNNFFMPIVA